MACTQDNLPNNKASSKNNLQKKLIKMSNEFSDKLIQAVSTNQYEAVKSLLKEKNKLTIGYKTEPCACGKPNCKKIQYKEYDIKQAALAHAIRAKNFPLVKLLVEHGATKTFCDFDNANLFFIATIPDYFDAKIFNYLVSIWQDKKVCSDLNVDIKNIDGETPFYIACVYGRLDIVRALHKIGANINLPKDTSERYSPLHIAISSGYSLIVDYLAKQPEIDLTYLPPGDDFGDTCLSYAAFFRRDNMVQSLASVTPKALIDAKGRSEKTALMWASRQGTLASMKILIEAGANIHYHCYYSDNNGNMMSRSLISNIFTCNKEKMKDFHISDTKEMLEKINYLLNLGIKILEEDLNNAAEIDNPTVLKELLLAYEKQNGKEATAKIIPELFLLNIKNQREIFLEGARIDENECCRFLLNTPEYLEIIQKKFAHIFLSLLTRNNHRAMQCLFKLAPNPTVKKNWQTYLLSTNIREQIKSTDFRSPVIAHYGLLTYTVMLGFKEMTAILLDQGADFNEMIDYNGQKRTILYLSIFAKNKSTFGVILQRLINQNPDIKAWFLRVLTSGKTDLIDVKNKNREQSLKIQKLISEIPNYLQIVLNGVDLFNHLIIDLTKFHKMIKFSEEEINTIALQYPNQKRGFFPLSISQLAMMIEMLVKIYPEILNLEPTQAERAFLFYLKKTILSNLNNLFDDKVQNILETKQTIESGENDNTTHITMLDVINMDEEDSDEDEEEEQFFERDEFEIEQIKTKILSTTEAEILKGEIGTKFYQDAITKAAQEINGIKNQLKDFMGNTNTLQQQEKDDLITADNLFVTQENAIANFLKSRKKIQSKIHKKLEKGKLVSAELLVDKLKNQTILSAELDVLENTQKNINDCLIRVRKILQNYIKHNIETIAQRFKIPSFVQSELQPNVNIDLNKLIDQNVVYNNVNHSQAVNATKESDPQEKLDASEKIETKANDDNREKDSALGNNDKLEKNSNDDRTYKKKKKPGNSGNNSPASSTPQLKPAQGKNIEQNTENFDLGLGLGLGLHTTASKTMDTKEKLEQVSENLPARTAIPYSITDKKETLDIVAHSAKDNKHIREVISGSVVNKQNSPNRLASTTRDTQLVQDTKYSKDKAHYPKPSQNFLRELNYLTETLDEINLFDKNNEQYESSLGLLLCARDALLGIASRAMDLIKSIEPVMATKFRNVLFHALDDLLPFSNHSLLEQQFLYAEVKVLIQDILPFLYALRDQRSRECAREKMFANPLFKRIMAYQINNNPQTTDEIMLKFNAHEKAQKLYDSCGHSPMIIHFAKGFATACSGALAATIRDNKDKPAFKQVWKANLEKFLECIRVGRGYRHPEPNMNVPVNDNKKTQNNQIVAESQPQNFTPIVNAYLLSQNKRRASQSDREKSNRTSPSGSPVPFNKKGADNSLAG